MKKNLIATISALMAVIMLLTTAFSLSASATTVTIADEEQTESVFPKMGIIDAPLKTATTPSNTVGVMTRVKKDTQESTYMHIFWDAVENVTGYNIYMRNVSNGDEYSLIATISDCEYTINDLPSANSFEIKVAAYVTVEDGTLLEGEPYVLSTATTADAIKKTPSIARSSNVIQFSWSKVPRASGYQVYRMYYKTKKFVLYKNLKGNSNTTMSDTSLEQGRGYFYKVRAYYSDWGCYYMGDWSPTFRAVAGLCAPGVRTLTSQLWRVSLTWNRNAYAYGYDIYASSTSSSSGFKLLGTTRNLYWNTIRLDNNKRYYFRIVPYKYVGDYKVTGTWTPTSKVVTNKAYGKSCGKTYIEISREQQLMWYYINGNLYVVTPVVTGNYNSMDTPKGCFSIYSKQSPATLMGNSYVTYWIPFYMGCGIHDASWRYGNFGGTIYKGNGSHGCVNTPFSAVKKIYNKAPIGTPVVVY